MTLVDPVLCLVAQSCLILCDPVDCNLPGSSVHGIFQPNSAGTLRSESETQRKPEVPASPRGEALLYYTTPSGVPRGPSQLYSISVFSEAP